MTDDMTKLLLAEIQKNRNLYKFLWKIEQKFMEKYCCIYEHLWI